MLPRNKQAPLLFILASLLAFQNTHALEMMDKWSHASKEDKLRYANIGGALAITVWGITNWDYGERSAHADSEGWFAKSTKSGGADKLGHLYSGYVSGRILSSLYESWGYDTNMAALYGALSSFGLLSFMEIGDSFSSQYGFSYEDFIINGVGSYIGYILETHPGLDKKIDLRVEYKPSADNGIDIFTDYENTKYLIALKIDGFRSVKSKYLKYLELHLGYFTRGFDDINRSKERNIYVGLGLNFSKLFREKSFKKTAVFLNYFQVPGTDIQTRL